FVPRAASAFTEASKSSSAVRKVSVTTSWSRALPTTSPNPCGGFAVAPAGSRKDSRPGATGVASLASGRLQIDAAKTTTSIDTWLIVAPKRLKVSSGAGGAGEIVQAGAGAGHVGALAADARRDLEMATVAAVATRGLALERAGALRAGGCAARE